MATVASAAYNPEAKPFSSTPGSQLPLLREDTSNHSCGSLALPLFPVFLLLNGYNPSVASCSQINALLISMTFKALPDLAWVVPENPREERI